jgi:hypothetical protein
MQPLSSLALEQAIDQPPLVVKILRFLITFFRGLIKITSLQLMAQRRFSICSTFPRVIDLGLETKTKGQRTMWEIIVNPSEEGEQGDSPHSLVPKSRYAITKAPVSTPCSLLVLLPSLFNQPQLVERHLLQSSLGTPGAMRLEQLCQDLEDMSKSSAPQETQALVSQLEAEYDWVEAILQVERRRYQG